MVAAIAIVAKSYTRSLRGIVALVAIVAERYTRVIASNGCSGCDSCGEIYSVLEGDGCTGSPHIQ